MNLNAEQREHLRWALIRHLADNPTRFGLAVPLLRQMVADEGTEVDPSTIKAELLYLQDKDMVVEVPKPLSPENSAWRITATGRDVFAMRGKG